MRSIIFIVALLPILVLAQEEKAYSFTKKYEVATTSVKNQQRAGTCWSFSATSFLESEIIRIKDKEIDLSELYFVRYAYANKADNFIRLHGKTNFSQGGQAHDVITVIMNEGMVPEDEYKGLNYGTKEHDHTELESAMKGFLNGVLKGKSKKLSTAWKAAFDGILNAYFGTVPGDFTYDKQNYSAQSFPKEMGIVPEDYIELTSYMHLPFYEKVNLKIPDNWSGDLYYNLPLPELMEVMENALKNGYSICWDGDVSERSFSHSAGVAIWPEEDWSDLSRSEAKIKLETIQPEKKATIEDREATFDNQTSTDDHLMHLTGLYTDQNGTKYYKTKNSWGDDSNDHGGYLYMSENYVMIKTTAIMIHKDAVPEKIKTKLGLK